MRDLSQRLMAHETEGNKASKTTAQAAFQVFERLRPHLAVLMGNAGFRALLSRALAVADAEVAWLHTVQVNPDGSLQGLDELEAQVSREQMAEGCVFLIAQLLGLLGAFIGENLTVQIVGEVWPKLSLVDLDFDEGV